MERKRKEKIVNMTWKEFLSEADVSDWKWSNLYYLNIVGEENDYYVAKISVKDILDRPDVRYTYEGGKLIIDWWTSIQITDPDNVPDIFIQVWKKQKQGDFICDGQLYTI